MVSTEDLQDTESIDPSQVQFFFCMNGTADLVMTGYLFSVPKDLLYMPIPLICPIVCLLIF